MTEAKNLEPGVVAQEEVSALLDRAAKVMERVRTGHKKNGGSFDYVVAHVVGNLAVGIGGAAFAEWIPRICTESNGRENFKMLNKGCEKLERIFAVIDTHPKLARELCTHSFEFFPFLDGIQAMDKVTGKGEAERMLDAIEEYAKEHPEQ